MHELWVLDQDNFINITPLISKLSWTSNLDTLGDQLNFDIVSNDAKHIPQPPIDLGSIIVLRNEDEIFRGEVITERLSGRESKSYDVFDFAFFLNKSKDIYQFNNLQAHNAIVRMLEDYNVPIGQIEPIALTIDKLYADKRLSDIIKDILQVVEEQTKTKYIMEMYGGKLNIVREETEPIKATFSLADNLQSHEVSQLIINPSRTRSIDNMKNAIKMICENSVVYEEDRDDLIQQYGRLQETKTINADEKKKASQLAKNLLESMAIITEDNSLTLPGNDEVRAGKILEIEESITGMSGKYRVKNCTHTLENGHHFMNLGLEVV
ncbi:XkdQ/YqbQ family protein [Vallitalea okinawensis]|uniref:XkdQ/YqbQ family protein n=1 Tax=Vallitalea okinawensis TaxID=2078660 RepID=UPI000CFC65BA|nr:hypothetical protein [Vallitalea okinawensis]